MSMIHPSAIIEDGAKIGKDVTVEAFAVITKNVTLGDGVIVKSHAYIDGNTTIGENTHIYPGACIGLKTQAKKFQGENTYVEIGKNCEIREYVTVNASYGEGSIVKIGDDCLIMAYCHIAHHCVLGNHVIMSNNSMLAGHVEVEDFVIIGGMTPIHQNCRIGRHSMVGGFSRVTHDIPPFSLGAGSPYKLGGLNLVGLKRRNFSMETRKQLTRAFKVTYRSGLRFAEAIEQLQKEFPDSEEVGHWIQFCLNSKRGLIGFHDGSSDLAASGAGPSENSKCSNLLNEANSSGTNL